MQNPPVPPGCPAPDAMRAPPLVGATPWHDASRMPPEGRRLLEGDGRAGALELRLGLLRGLLVDALENSLGGAIDDGLRLTEAEAGERAHLLDDLDLLVTGGLENDVERVLLLDLLNGGGRPT